MPTEAKKPVEKPAKPEAKAEPKTHAGQVQQFAADTRTVVESITKTLNGLADSALKIHTDADPKPGEVIHLDGVRRVQSSLDDVARALSAVNAVAADLQATAG